MGQNNPTCSKCVDGGKVVKNSHLDIGYSNLDGTSISEGTPIGKSGATGNPGFYNKTWGIKAKYRHVHIEARVGSPFGKVIDPEGFFKTKFDGNGEALESAESKVTNETPFVTIRATNYTLKSKTVDIK